MKGEPKSSSDLIMSEKEFDRIMGQALQVKPEDAKKAPKRSTKAKPARKGTRPRQK